MISSILIKLIGIYSILFLSFLSLVILTGDASANDKAIIKMALVLVLLWVVLVGSLMRKYRDHIKTIVLKIPLPYPIVFFIFSMSLILFEEVFTVGLTNLAHLFGGEIGVSFIAASTNYFHVIFFHSAIMFVPFVLAWSYLLTKYDFNPNQVFLLFGVLGVIAEGFLSPTAYIAGFWIFIYGLMVYLPAYCLPDRENLKKPGFLAYILAIFLPLILSIPMFFFVMYIRGIFGIELFA
jgi:hypothetical protein